MLALRPYVTAGVALTAAGLIAVTPIAASHPVNGQARAVALTAGPSDDAFTVDGLTFDPGSGGYNTFDPLVGLAPLLKIGGGLELSTNPIATQPLDVYSGGSEVGTAHTSVYASDLLGIDSAQFTVQTVTPPVADIQAALTNSDLDFSGAGINVSDLANALTDKIIPYGTGDIASIDVLGALSNAGINLNGNGITAADIAAVLNNVDTPDLPDAGTVYSITNLGSGWANVYEAVPNSDGTAASSITDTLVTPFGNLNIPTSYDAIAPMDPGSAFAGLGVSSDASGLSDNAFTIDDTTFDPGSDGFTGIGPTAGTAPLLEIGGGSLSGIPLGSQDLDIYDSSGTDLGSIDTTVTTSNLLGFIDTTQLSVSSVDAATDLTNSETAELPAVGTVYSVTDFGGGFENVYEAVPNADGTAASSITDYLVTPFGNIDLSSMFDAIAQLDPGDAAAGVSDAASGFDLFDPSTWF